MGINKTLFPPILFTKVKNIEMQLLAIFLVLNIQFSFIFASPPNLHWLSSETTPNVEGYECGNVLFSEREVKEALSLALNSIDQGFRYPEKYQGKLYSESGFEEYFLYPIKNGPQSKQQVKHVKSHYFIVFTRNDKKEVDVIAKITTGDYTKCIRRYRTLQGPSHSVPEDANGYLCGHNFFTDDTVRKCLINAQAKVGGNNKYPTPYIGSLYPENGEYSMWPIMRDNTLYISGSTKIGPYFLIINNQRQVVDVVVRGFSNNFLRCLRIRKPPTAPESDPFSKLFVQPPRPGYACGKVFFYDKALEENAEIVKDKVAKGINGNLPEEYFGPPYHERCLIWPILRSERLYNNGQKGIFRLILTPEYKVRGVAMLINKKLKPCERNTIAAKKNHDTSAYQCKKQHFSHQKLAAAAEEACVKMRTAKDNIYPARCEGTGFKLDRSYFTYPVFRDGIVGKFKRNPGPYRVMINTNCEVVGALTAFLSENNRIFENSSRKKFMRCHRIDDGSLPLEFFGANAEIFYEYSNVVKYIKPLQVEQ